MAKLKGKYTFKEVLDVEGLIAAGELTEYFNFISGYEGNPVQHYVLEHSGMYIEYDYFGTGIYFGYLTPPNKTMNLVYYTKWQNERLRYVDFGDGVTMSDRLSSWVLANADPVVDPQYSIKTSTLTAIADSIRAKTGGSDPILTENMASEIEGIDTAEPWDESFTVKEGAAIIPVAEAPENDIIFIDYDGKILYSYSVEEAQALTKLPPLPEHEGLICQGWNWTLEDIQEYKREITVGAMYITDDGTTRIYISLDEGRTSPMIGVGVKGTVTVDWGDGTEPDTLTGTSVDYGNYVYTPNHNYKKAGNYVIRLTVDGEAELAPFYNEHGAGFLGYTNATDIRNTAYGHSVQKIEIGNGILTLTMGLFRITVGARLDSITVPYGVTYVGSSALAQCYTKGIVIPSSVTAMGYYSIPNSEYFSVPNNVKMTNSMFNESRLRKITIPAQGNTRLESSFASKSALIRSVFVPPSIASISTSAFSGCYSMKYYDFTSHTAVPTLSATDAFSGIPADCEIRVPAALYDEWIAATNWSSLASKIVAV